MATIKGQNLRIFVGERPIAAALQCDLNVQLNVSQYSTKDDEDDFTRLVVASLVWSLHSNAVVTNDDEEDAIGAVELMDMIGQHVRVQLNTAGGDKNRETSGSLLGGEAVISDVKITAQNRQRTVYDVTLTGVKNMLINISPVKTADSHYIITANNHRVCVSVA